MRKVFMALFLVAACVATVAGQQHTIGLLVGNASSLDTEEQAARSFALNHGFTVTNIDPAMILSNPSILDGVQGFWADNASAPTGFNNATIRQLMRSQLESGKGLLTTWYGTYVIQYFGYGTASPGSGWSPVVSDHEYWVDKMDNHPIFDGLSSWIPPAGPPDDESKLMWYVTPGYIPMGNVNITMSVPVTQSQYAHIWASYGWGGQTVNSALCSQYGITCTNQRGVHISSFPEAKVGNGSIMFGWATLTGVDHWHYGAMGYQMLQNVLTYLCSLGGGQPQSGKQILVYSTRNMNGNAILASDFDTDLPSILAEDGFSVTVTDRSAVPTVTSVTLAQYDQLWFISGTNTQVLSPAEVQAILSFQSSGKSLMVISDGCAYSVPANQFSPSLGVTFSSLRCCDCDHCGSAVGCNIDASGFLPHAIWTGVTAIQANLNEGDLTASAPAQVIATQNGIGMVAVRDGSGGRVAWDATIYRFQDVGVHPQLSIRQADNARYVKNLANWLRQGGEAPNYAIHLDKSDMWTESRQTVLLAGRVVDSRTGAAASNVSVMIHDPIPLSPSGFDQIYQTTTDDQGRFEYTTIPDRDGFYGIGLEAFHNTGTVNAKTNALVDVGIGGQVSLLKDLTVRNDLVNERITVTSILTGPATLNDHLAGRSVQLTDIRVLEPEQTVTVLKAATFDPAIVDATPETGNNDPVVSIGYEFCVPIPIFKWCMDHQGTISGSVEAGLVLGAYGTADRQYGIIAGVGANAWLLEGSGVITVGQNGVALQGTYGASIAQVTVEFDVSKVYERGRRLSVHSPVELCLIDAENRKVGVDFQTGRVVTQIPGCTYTGPHVEPQKLRMRAGATEPTTVLLRGIKSGNYAVVDEHLFSGAIVTRDSVAGVITEGETLTLIPVAPPANLTATCSGNDIRVMWSYASAATPLGFNIFRRRASDPFFTKLTDQGPVQDTCFVDREALEDSTYYAVATVLQQGRESDLSAQLLVVKTSCATLEGTVVDAHGHGLLGVFLSIFDANNALWKTITTDDTGYYRIDSIPNGNYSIAITPPLGFRPDEETRSFVINHVPVEVDFTLSDISTGKVCDIWWWKDQLKAIHDGAYRWQGLTRSQVDQFGTLIFGHFYSRNDIYAMQIPGITYASGPRALTYDDIYSLLFGAYDESFKAKAERAILINLLNVAAGRQGEMAVISADGYTWSQAITYFYDLYVVGGNDNYFTVYDNLKKLYMKQQIAAGVIAAGTPNIAYRDNDEPLPTNFALAQNYPNPFNPETRIDYALPSAASVRLEVFNLLGQKVRSLKDQAEQAGSYSVIWNGRDDAGRAVSSGVYLYRLTAGDFVETKKMMLLK